MLNFLEMNRGLTENCGFSTALQTIILDMLICGLREEALQRRLQAKDDFTRSKAQKNTLTPEELRKEQGTWSCP